MRRDSALARNGKREGKGWTYGARFEADPSGVERDSLADEGKWARVGLVGAFVMPVEGAQYRDTRTGARNELVRSGYRGRRNKTYTSKNLAGS